MEAIPQPTCCETCCDDRIETAVPGPTGAAGAAGSAGADGDDGVTPWTLTTADFAMPAEGATVAVSVVDNAWMFVGQIVQVEGAGYMEVTVVPGIATSVTLENIEDSGAGTYPDNVAPATVVADPVKIVPSGPTGPTGAATGAPADATYWTRTANGTLSSESALGLLGTGYVKSTTATGVPATVPKVPYTDLSSVALVAGAIMVSDGAGNWLAGYASDDVIEYDGVVVGVGAAVNIDWSLGRYFTVTMNPGGGVTTITHINTVPYKNITVVVLQDSVAAGNITWAGVDRWPGGLAFDIAATLACKAFFSFSKDLTEVTGTVVNDCS